MEKVFEFKKYAKVTVTIDDSFVRIKRKGFMNAMTVGLSGEKAINLNDITSVQMKKPGISSGYIQFSLPGGNESTGVINAGKDENSIMFLKPELSMAEEIKAIIESHIANKSNNLVHSPPVTIDSADEIRKFKSLLEDGIITQEEFDSKKRQLLGI